MIEGKLASRSVFAAFALKIGLDKIPPRLCSPQCFSAGKDPKDGGINASP